MMSPLSVQACLVWLQLAMLTATDDARDIGNALADSIGQNASLSPTMQLSCEGLAALRRRHGSMLINGVVAFEGYDPQGLAPIPRPLALLLAFSLLLLCGARPMSIHQAT